jgi:hypothetical protein
MVEAAGACPLEEVRADLLCKETMELATAHILGQATVFWPILLGATQEEYAILCRSLWGVADIRLRHGVPLYVAVAHCGGSSHASEAEEVPPPPPLLLIRFEEFRRLDRGVRKLSTLNQRCHCPVAVRSGESRHGYAHRRMAFRSRQFVWYARDDL